MILKRGLVALTTSAIAFGAMALPASAQSSQSADLSSQRNSGGYSVPVPTLLTETKMDWVRGSSEWVNLTWTSKADISNVRVHVTPSSKDLTVEYPSNHDGFTSLLDNDSLSANEIDFTSVRLTTDASSRGTKHALVYIKWTYEGQEFELYSGRLQLSNKDYKGADFAILTEDASASTDTSAADDNWVEFSYKGLAPITSDMRMTIESDLEIYHPQGRFTSLHHNGTLHGGETDVARVWLDPELLTGGQHKLVVNISYRNAKGESKTESHVVVLTIEQDEGQA